TYTVTETITTGGCSKSNSVVVTVNQLPSAIAGDNRAICLGANTTLGATTFEPETNTFSWTSNPAGFTSTLANPTVSPMVTTTYTVTETIPSSGCSKTGSVTVTVNPLPDAAAGDARSICLGVNTTLGASTVAGSTYSWSSVPSGFTSTEANPSVSPAVNTTYTVLETITATGCTKSNSVVVTVNPLPAAVAGDARSICLNGNTTLGAAAVSGSSYSWTSDPAGFTSTLANPTVTPTVTSTYTVTETNTTTGCNKSNSVTVTVNPLPAAVAGDARSICLGASTTLGNTSFEPQTNTFSWTSVPAGFTSTVAKPTVSPTVTTTYTVVETIPSTGCSKTGSVVVTVNPLPAAVAGDPRSICLGANTTLGAAAVSGSTYSWSSDPAGFTSTLANPTVTPTVTTTYTVTETITAGGCSKSNSVVVTVNQLPDAVAGDDRSICLGANTTLGATTFEPETNTFSWTSSPAGFTSTEANPSVNPIETTVYTLTETIPLTGCSKSSSVTVTVNPLPGAVAGANRAICIGVNTTLGAASLVGSTYSWSSVPSGFTSTEANPSVSPAVNTTYTVLETITATGCTKSNSVVVTVNPLPAAFAGDDRTICLGAGTILGEQTFGARVNTFSWTSVPSGFTSTQANPTVNPTQTTTYTVTETIPSTGCSKTGSVVVTVNPLPDAIAGADRSICIQTSTTLGAAPVTGSTYSWSSNPSGFTSTIANPTVSPSVNTTYTVAETITTTGCTNTHSVAVTLKPYPAAVAGADRNLCLGSSTTLGAAAVPGSTYFWTSVPSTMTSTVANPPVTPLVTTTYTVVETNTATLCTNSHSVTVTVYPVLQVSVAIAADANPVCLGSTVTLTATPVNGGTNPTYQWKLNNLVIPGATNSTYTFYPYTPTTAVTCVLSVPTVPCTTGSPATSNVVNIIVPEVCPTTFVTGVVGSGEITCYDATQTITVAGGGTTFTISDGGQATMIAGQNILYLPGTTVVSGGYMLGKIAPNGPYCGQQAPSIVTVVTGE
ncbi:MAG: hypothetical protein WCK09_21145, partial [Bacteroidota bacterium]